MPAPFNLIGRRVSFTVERPHPTRADGSKKSRPKLKTGEKEPTDEGTIAHVGFGGRGDFFLLILTEDGDLLDRVATKCVILAEDEAGEEAA